jgi:hypothetical protein
MVCTWRGIIGADARPNLGEADKVPDMIQVRPPVCFAAARLRLRPPAQLRHTKLAASSGLPSPLYAAYCG